MTQVTLQSRKPEQKPVLKHNPRLNVIPQKGVRGICGHIARDKNSYCGNPKCSPWGY